MDNRQLLHDISELNHLFRDSASIETLLNKAVEMVAERSQSAVCSIYLYDPQRQELVLRATKGLSPESVGHVRLKLGQGLTGLALKEMKPVCETDASRNPNYHYFPGIFEERYDAFLAMPIARGISRLGVLVLQRGTGQSFCEEDITALEVVASQLANIIENAQFILGIHAPREEPAREPLPAAKLIKAKSAAEGFAYAPAMVVDKQKSLTAFLHRDFGRMYTLEDFNAAVANTSRQLEELQEQVEHQLSDAASLIFAAHLMILKDKEFIGRIARRIEQGANAPAAVAEVATEYMQVLVTSSNAHMREKVNDIEDLAVRLINNLLREGEPADIHKDHVVITQGLFPSDLLKLSSEGIKAVILVGGGITAHISILARSLNLPVVIVNTFELLDVSDGTPILVDADVGGVYVDPDDTILEKYQAMRKARLTLHEQKRLMKPQTVTADGTRVQLLVNINLLSDLKVATQLRCDGIGLYRTEFPFIVRTTFPTEAEQYTIYRTLVESMPGKPVTLRTLDAGGDKILSYYHDIEEQNPAMGMRSIRFTLRNPAIFGEQLRAILRAGAGADLRIMFPMISSVDEFLQARDAVYEARDQLAKQGIEHHASPKLGIMVELPSVADLMADFAGEVDFFSIGTNDLIQFMLGVDRTNESVADLYLPHHPAMLRVLNRIVRGAVEAGRDISVCGDMAHQPQYVPFLIGVGVRTLSVDPVYLLRTQQAIAGVSIGDAEDLARSVLAQSRISEVEALLKV